jgi:hypothetical protein
MLVPLHSEDVIEALVIMNCGDSTSAQVRHMYRESLRNLVRLAKAERNVELRLNLNRMITSSAKSALH